MGDHGGAGKRLRDKLGWERTVGSLGGFLIALAGHSSG